MTGGGVDWLYVLLVAVALVAAGAAVGFLYVQVTENSEKRGPEYCRTCGYFLVTEDQPRPLGMPGEMQRVRKCPNRRQPYDGHYQRVLMDWDEGPLYDEKTGHQIRDV